MKENILHKLTHLSEKLGEEVEFNKQLIKALDLSNEGIAILDKDGKYLWLNQSHETMFGYKHKELIGKSWEILYEESRLQYFYEVVFPILEEKGNWNGETIGISKNDRIRVEQMVYLTSLICGGFICTCIKIN